MKDFDKLAKLVARLRAPGGCEWDRALTLKKARLDVVSEARELANAIENEDYEEAREELGDLMWSALILAQIAEEEGRFSVKDSLEIACEKLVRRHPHVFGDSKVKNPKAALDSFNAAKQKEKQFKKQKTYDVPMRDFVASVYIVKNGKVLLIHHKKLGIWIPCGGHIEENELPCEAAKREAEEETGLKVKLIGSGKEKTEKDKVGKVNVLVHPFTIQLEDIKHNHQHIDLIYYAEVIGGKEKINKEETLGLKWFSEDDLNKADDLGAQVREQATCAIRYFNEKNGKKKNKNS